MLRCAPKIEVPEGGETRRRFFHRFNRRALLDRGLMEQRLLRLGTARLHCRLLLDADVAEDLLRNAREAGRGGLAPPLNVAVHLIERSL